MLTKLLILFFGICCCTQAMIANKNLLLESPCPQIFNYQYNENGLLYGSIEIFSPNDNVVQLNVELSVGNNVENYNGHIELAYAKSQVIDDVLHRRPIQYKIFFPYWLNIPPKVTKILVNGDLICSGPKLTIGGFVSVLTTINLQHTLTINVNSLATLPDDLKKKQYERPYYHNQHQSPVPKNHQINFNPRPPKDTTKLFTDNPFLSNAKDTTDTYSSNPFLNNPKDTFMNNPFLSGVRTTTITNTNNIPAPPPTTTITPSSNNLLNSQQRPNNNIQQNNPFFNGQITEKPLKQSNNNRPEVVGVQNQNNFPLNRQPFADTCGRPIITTQLIFNGRPVPRGSYPWLVAMFAVKNTGLDYKCSGTLISKRHVVTAAHCVKIRNRVVRSDEILLVLGKLNIKKWTMADGERTVESEMIHIHPDYETMTSNADIAVIVLVDIIQFTKFIRPICLWAPNSNDLNHVIGQKGTVVGWGKNEYGEISTAEPKETTLPIVSQQQCLNSSDSFQYITSDKTFCAGYRDGSGPCNGDSGSGFIMQYNNRWYLRGIVSMSLSDVNNRTCDLMNYVVFTDASKYVDWLLSFIIE